MKKGLIIKSPWIEKIFEGKKTWEIRNKDVNYRGKIYLIKSGTDKVKLYEKPIAYKHPRGAIIWVNLDKEENVIEQIPN